MTGINRLTVGIRAFLKVLDQVEKVYFLADKEERHHLHKLSCSITYLPILSHLFCISLAESDNVV